MRHRYADFVGLVEKPARYMGGEYQSVVKDWSRCEVSIAMAFPDIYDIGMSHLGTKILYSLLNKHEKIVCERAFTPWPDMEKELRTRALPLLTLETARPLKDFDVVGISLQFELTFTNVLTLLDLGGVPLRARDRGDNDPLVIGGGPTATHPEAISAFFDAFMIGEAEETLPDLLLFYASLKRAGVPRRERLIQLAMRGGIYVPELYTTQIDPVTGFEVTTGVIDPRVPRKVNRHWVKDLNKFPFPSDAPVAFAEAVFDRVSVEIARGCTEGCRFCQAGMIYRPLRERDPDSIVKSVVDGIKNGGYDETSLTALSTADVSCITPLVKRVMTELKKQQVSLSISSLRAYGLNEELLDEMSQIRATGLTFAPEAGTQRMRDVINKNITEEDIASSAEKIFSRGWSRMKCYFMIGLPTETDEDVDGIVLTGGRLRRLGRKIRQDADVTVSVSSHVPKPHTPFQWVRMDSIDELKDKQRRLRALADREKVDLKYHEVHGSHVEGILSRGDRRMCDVVELAWRKGARFDGWDEHFRLAYWELALAEVGVDRMIYLNTIPVDARLPWDHIDIGLDDGFLLDEYRKALKDRVSPPCGKPFATLLHHTNLQDARADERKLVCYDCGIACDMTQMKAERIAYLTTLGAEAPLPKGEATAAKPVVRLQMLPRQTPKGFDQVAGARYRVWFERVGRASFWGHLDTMRLLIRIFRRAGVELIYSHGFHPKPQISLAPALGLGISSVGEVMDAKLSFAGSADDLAAVLTKAAPEGIRFTRAVPLPDIDPGLGKLIEAAEYVVFVPRVISAAELRRENLVVERVQKRARKKIDIGALLLQVDIVPADEMALLCARLAWPELPGTLLRFSVAINDDGGCKPTEVVEALLGERAPAGTTYARMSLTLARRSAPRRKDNPPTLTDSAIKAPTIHA